MLLVAEGTTNTESFLANQYISSTSARIPLKAKDDMQESVFVNASAGEQFSRPSSYGVIPMTLIIKEMWMSISIRVGGFREGRAGIKRAGWV